MDDAVILPSARRHGVQDEDILHAIRNWEREFLGAGGERIVIGPAYDGRMLEIGVVEMGWELLVIHAMPARSKFWP